MKRTRGLLLLLTTLALTSGCVFHANGRRGSASLSFNQGHVHTSTCEHMLDFYYARHVHGPSCGPCCGIRYRRGVRVYR